MGFLASLRRPNNPRSKSSSDVRVARIKEDASAAWSPLEGQVPVLDKTGPTYSGDLLSNAKVAFPSRAVPSLEDVKTLPSLETATPAPLRKRRRSLKEIFSRPTPEQFPPVPSLPDLVYSPSSSAASDASPCSSSASSTIARKGLGRKMTAHSVGDAKNPLATRKDALEAIATVAQSSSSPLAERARIRDARTDSQLKLHRLSLGLDALDLNINVDRLAGGQAVTSGSAMHGMVATSTKTERALASPLLKQSHERQESSKTMQVSEDNYGSDSDDDRALAHSTPATSLDDTDKQASPISPENKTQSNLRPPSLNLRINAPDSRRTSAYYSATNSPVSPAMSSPSSSFGCAGPGTMSSMGGLSPRNLSFGARLCLDVTLQKLKIESPNSPNTQPEKLNTAFGRAYPSSIFKLVGKGRSSGGLRVSGLLKTALQRTRLVRRLENRRLTLVEEVELDGFKRLLTSTDGHNRLPPSPTSPTATAAMTGVLPSVRVMASITSNALSSALGDDKTVVQPASIAPVHTTSYPVSFKEMQEQVWKRWLGRPGYTERTVSILQSGSVQLLSMPNRKQLSTSPRARYLAGVAPAPGASKTVRQAQNTSRAKSHTKHVQVSTAQAEVAMKQQPRASIASASASISLEASNTERQHHGTSNESTEQGARPPPSLSITSLANMAAKSEKRASFLARAFQRPVPPPRSSTMPSLPTGMASNATEKEFAPARPASQLVPSDMPDIAKSVPTPRPSATTTMPEMRRHSMHNAAPSTARPAREPIPVRPTSQNALPTSSSAPSLAIPRPHRGRGSSTPVSEMSRSSILEANEGGSDEDEEMPLAFLKRDRAANASEDNIQYTASHTRQPRTASPRASSTDRRSLLVSNDTRRPVSTALSDYAADELHRLQEEVKVLRAQQARSEEMRREMERMKAMEAERQTQNLSAEGVQRIQDEQANQKKRDERKRWEDHRRRSARFDTAPSQPAQSNLSAAGLASQHILQPQPMYPQQPFVHPGFYNFYQSPLSPQAGPVPYGHHAGLPAFAPNMPYAMVPTPPATPPRYPSPGQDSSNRLSSGSGYNSDSSSKSRRMSAYNPASTLVQLDQQANMQQYHQPNFHHNGLIQQATSPNGVSEKRRAQSSSAAAQRRSVSYGSAEESGYARQPMSSNWGAAPSLPRSASTDPRTANRGSRAFLNPPPISTMPTLPRSRTSYMQV